MNVDRLPWIPALLLAICPLVAGSAENTATETVRSFILRMQEGAMGPVVAYCTATVPEVKRPLEAEFARFRGLYREAAAAALNKSPNGEQLDQPVPPAMVADWKATNEQMLAHVKTLDADAYCPLLRTSLAGQTVASLQALLEASMGRYVTLLDAKPPSQQELAPRFGILREKTDGTFEFVRETSTLPKRIKGTGFRFGVKFENPQGKMLEWYEVVHFPSKSRDATGNLRKDGNQTLRTATYHSNRTSVVDGFWFDEGDPFGRHTLELYINGKLAYSVDFDVTRDGGAP